MLACASFVERQWGEMVVLACDSFAWALALALALALACGCLVLATRISGNGWW